VLSYAPLRQVVPRLSAQLDQGRTDLVMTPATEERRSSTSTAWDIEDVATYLKISTRHLGDIRAEDPSFPPPRMLGSLPRWHPKTVEDWLAAAEPAVAAKPEPKPRKRVAARVH
jgi:predicted DNA-binding transcriptional regulator AlpA